MSYTIKEASKRSGISEYTIRYYDKEGLLPFLEKTAYGTRKFKNSDLNLIFIIRFLKKAGMQLSTIKRYVQCCINGNSKMHERMAIVREHKVALEKKKQELEELIYVIDKTLLTYENTAQADSDDDAKLPHMTWEQ